MNRCMLLLPDAKKQENKMTEKNSVKIIVGCFQNQPMAGARFGIEHKNGRREYTDKNVDAGFIEKEYFFTEPDEGSVEEEIKCPQCGMKLKFRLLSEKKRLKQVRSARIMSIIFIPAAILWAIYLYLAGYLVPAILVLIAGLFVFWPRVPQKARLLFDERGEKAASLTGIQKMALAGISKHRCKLDAGGKVFQL